MIYTVYENYYDDSKIEGAKEMAEAKLQELRSEVLAAEAHRFTVAQEIVDGPNTTWQTADLEGVEVGVYMVFNHETGLHEKVESLTQAKQLMQQFQEKFLTDIGLDAVKELAEMPKPKAQPISTGAQSL